MGVYSISMLKMALELARHDSVAYEDMASKFFEHFIAIADAINNLGGGLWDDVDGFYYDMLRDVQHVPNIKTPPTKRRTRFAMSLFAFEVFFWF